MSETHSTELNSNSSKGNERVNWQERVILITGASSGIGEATARLLGTLGATVALVARRADRLDQILADLKETSPNSRRWATDLSNPTYAARLAQEIWNHFGKIDVIINNAGAPMRRHVTKLTMEDIERAMTLNYLSPVAITLALLPDMIKQGKATIVNVSSLGGRLGITTEAAYCGSKFALAGWSEAISADLVGTGIDVRLILPGAIDTEIWDQPGNDAPLYNGPLVPASEVAQGIVDAIDSDQFEHYLPDLKAVVEMKTSDFDGFVAGMRAMADGSIDEDKIGKATRGTAP